MATVILSNGVAHCRFDDVERSGGLFERLATFLAPAFQPVSTVPEPSFAIAFSPFSAFPQSSAAQCIEPVMIRRSDKVSFDLHVQSGRLPDGRLAALDRSKATAFEIDAGRRFARIFVSDTSFVHCIEYIRYGALLVEEAAGTILLHASAAVGPRGAVLVLGEKGAGKTTALFSLLTQCDLGYFSGDKVLLRSPGTVAPLRAWPDYPHVGMGTLRACPALAERLRVPDRHEDGARKPDSHKELIPVEAFRRAVPPPASPFQNRVAAIVFPRRSAAAPYAGPVANSDKHIATLAEHIEFPFEFTPARWHGIFAPIVRRERGYDKAALAPLIAAPWYQLDGTVSPQKGWFQ